jgi:flagellar biosynthetic protein FlhB
MSDSSERTEKATSKRMKEARQKGRISSSHDLTGWVSLGAAMLAIPAVASGATDATTGMVASLRTLAQSPDPLVALDWFGNGLTQVVPIMTPMFVAAAAGALVGHVVQGGIHFKQLSFRVEHFDLVKGIGRLFGPHGWWEGGKAVLKSSVVALVLVAAIQNLVPLLANAGGLAVSSLLSIASGAAAALVQSAVVAGIGLALLDVFVVMRRNRKQTRMTKREVRDENKSSDGDPLVRAQRRSKQLAMSRNRMIAAVGGADVVLLNPTHVAVALKYEKGRSAPRLVAKGAGEVAAKIRERAAATGVPMVHDIPLARALYGACEVGHEIPVELYGAVARVLAFVMSLKSRGAALGVHRLVPAQA